MGEKERRAERKTRDQRGTPGAFTPVVLAGTYSAFSDDPLIAATTLIRAAHFNEIRQRTDTMRANAGLSGYPYTNNLVPGASSIAVIDVQELRSALNDARVRIGVAALTFTDPNLTAGQSVVKAIHIQELRSGAS